MESGSSYGERIMEQRSLSYRGRVNNGIETLELSTTSFNVHSDTYIKVVNSNCTLTRGTFIVEVFEISSLTWDNENWCHLLYLPRARGMENVKKT